MVRISFNYSEEDESTVKQILKTSDYRYALEEIYYKCRAQLKHGDSLGEKADELLEEIKGLASVYMD